MADSSAPATDGKLHGKVAIMTGGASGIGEATARAFAAHGARAIVIADVQDDKGREVAASIGLHRCAYFRCDVTDEEQVKALVDFTVGKYGRVDVMFSNAGVASEGEQAVLDLDLDAMDRLLAVNARGMAACVKHAARAMARAGAGGSVVCTASGLASRGTERYTDYVMAKHAVLGLVRSASLQLGAAGIRVNAVSPGLIVTPMALSAFPGDGAEEMKKMLGSRVALKLGGGRVPEAENVAEAVAFLASDEAEFVTGLDLAVDGGFAF